MAATAWLDDAVLPALPRWLEPIVAALRSITPEDLTRFLPPEEGGRPGAVLMLFGDDPEHGHDLLLIERSHDMRSHAGQPAFPGGAVADGEETPLAAALREACGQCLKRVTFDSRIRLLGVRAGGLRRG